MTREEFLEKYRHRLAGIALDAMFNESVRGGELALRLRSMLKQTDALIVEMWNDIPKAAANGQPLPTKK